MNAVSSMSPSSSVASPMDLGFANIGDEQSNDDIDLNNITPSIRLASSLSLLESHHFSGNRQNLGARRTPPKPLIKSDDVSTNNRLHDFSRGDGDPMPSGSCPDNIRPGSLPYRAGSGPYESPTSIGLAIPQGASGGSASSGAGTWTGGSNITSPSGESMARMGAGMPIFANSLTSDNQHVALLRARSKKDSHNRIERKRRDYINCQISELGTLLPDEMFRDNECKKNKGSILKNSVEYIYALRAENARFGELRKEANLATNLISKLVKHIKDFESVLPQEFLIKTPQLSEYSSQLQEWSLIHDSNQQLYQRASSPSPVSRAAVPGFVSVDTSESSPGMSSIGNEDLGYLDPKESSTSTSNRTRCTSLSSPGQTLGIPMDKLDVSGRPMMSGMESTNTPFGSLPTSRRLQQLLPIRPPITAVNTTPSRSMLSTTPSSLGGGCALKQSSSSKVISKQRNAKPIMAKMEEHRAGGGMPVNTKDVLFSNKGGFSGGLSSSLPIRMGPGECIGGIMGTGGNIISEMESDDVSFRLSESGDADLAASFKAEPLIGSPSAAYQPQSYHRFATAPLMSASQEAEFNRQMYQHQQQPHNWTAVNQSQRPNSAIGVQGGHPETPPMSLDELQFDPAL